jgi:maltose O-acetyltransferase
VIIKNKCYFGNGNLLSVSNNSQLDQNSKLLGHITIENNVMMGPDVVIMAITHDISDTSKLMNDPTNPSISKHEIIGNNVWIGTRVILMPGVKLSVIAKLRQGLLSQNPFPQTAWLGVYQRKFYIIEFQISYNKKQWQKGQK